jgi:hypothetical protein
MRFAVGQAFRCAVSGRQAFIAEIRDDGRAGQLRFDDNGQQQWVLWAQFINAEKWIPMGTRDVISQAQHQS